jgi:hypothetical protein
MRKPVVKARRRGSLAGIWLLALLLFRAYVPVGFMPASGLPFALELCPTGMAGMPAGHLHHAGTHTAGTHTAGTHTAGTHTDFETCPFGSAPAAGPLSHHIDFETTGPAPAQRIVAFEAPRLSLRPQRSHQPRAPPSFA